MNRAASASVAKSMAGIMSGHILKHPVPAGFAIQGKADVFDAWISRCYGLLYFTACLVLGREVASLCRTVVSRGS
jgi:hypothetical protein